jgi:hypothetical protein
LVEASKPVIPELPPIFNVEPDPWVKVPAPDRAVLTVNVLLFVVAELTVIVPLTTTAPPMVAVPEPLIVRLL